MNRGTLICILILTALMVAHSITNIIQDLSIQRLHARIQSLEKQP